MTMSDDEISLKETKVIESCARLKQEERRYQAWFDGLGETQGRILATQALEWRRSLQHERALVERERRELLVLSSAQFTDSGDEKSECKHDSGSHFEDEENKCESKHDVEPDLKPSESVEEEDVKILKTDMGFDFKPSESLGNKLRDAGSDLATANLDAADREGNKFEWKIKAKSPSLSDDDLSGEEEDVKRLKTDVGFDFKPSESLGNKLRDAGSDLETANLDAADREGNKFEWKIKVKSPSLSDLDDLSGEEEDVKTDL